MPASQGEPADAGGSDVAEACPLAFGEPKLLATIDGVPSGLVVHASRVYWTTRTALQHVPGQGGSIETLVTGTGLGGLVLAGGRVLDADLLWFEQASGGYSIRLWTIGQPLPRTILDGLPRTIRSVAATASAVYWLDVAPGSSPMLPTDVAAHRFWHQVTEDMGSVTSGGNTDSLTVLGSGLYFTNGYYGDPQGEFRIDRLPLEGPPPSSMARSVVPITATFVEKGDDLVEPLYEVAYFSEFDSGDGGSGTSIYRATVPDGAREVLVDAAHLSLSSERALIHDGRRIFWAEGPGDVAVRGMCVPDPGSATMNPIRELAHAAGEGTVVRMVVDGTTLYYAVAASDTMSLLYAVTTR